MSKQFWTFLGIGLAVVAAGIFFLLFSTKSAHLELDGKILKVRVLSLNPNASIVVVDFRETNPSDVGFLVKSVTMKLDPASGDAADGTPISKFDVENVFKYEKLLGPKYNERPEHPRQNRSTSDRRPDGRRAIRAGRIGN